MAFQIASAAGLGLAAGLFFFGVLWLTVRRLGKAARPHLLLLGSFLVRTAIVVAAFYVLAADGLGVVLAAAAGFLAARMLAVWHLAPKGRSAR